MQIKTIAQLGGSHPLGGYYFRKTTTENNKYWQGSANIRTPVNCWWEWKIVWLLWKRVYQFLNSNYHIVQQFHFCVYPKVLKAETPRDICASLFTESLFMIAKR